LFSYCYLIDNSVIWIYQSNFNQKRRCVNMNNKLQIVRKEQGMSITELSRRSGLSRNAIYDIESGRTNPLGTTMYELSRALNKRVSEIFFNEDVI